MHNFKELKIWISGRSFVKDTYKITKGFPSEEQFVLTSQMRRAAISIPSNISEGAGRNTDKEFSRFLDIANGSAFELETQLYLSFDLEYISEEVLDSYLEKIQKIQKMIYSFKASLNL
jgi:four helix bundle protein